MSVSQMHSQNLATSIHVDYHIPLYVQKVRLAWSANYHPESNRIETPLNKILDHQMALTHQLLCNYVTMLIDILVITLVCFIDGVNATICVKIRPPVVE